MKYVIFSLFFFLSVPRAAHVIDTPAPKDIAGLWLDIEQAADTTNILLEQLRELTQYPNTYENPTFQSPSDRIRAAMVVKNHP